MCTALEKLKEEGREEGKIEGFIEAFKTFGVTMEVTAARLQHRCGLSETEAEAYVKKYW